MISRGCVYSTDRLLVREWHSLTEAQWQAQDLADVVTDMLTPPVTASLPEPWQGEYSAQRAREWIQARDDEGTVLLVVEQGSRLPIGLVILFEVEPADHTGVEIRLGYLLAETAWGKGMASELIAGFVSWCRGAEVAAIVGGVARGNVPSRRVLEKCGFTCVPATEESEEQMFEIRLRR